MRISVLRCCWVSSPRSRCSFDTEGRLRLATRRVALGLLLSAICDVAGATSGFFSPSALFAQVGTAERTSQVSAGVIWDWERRWRFAGGEVTGYWDLSASGWSYATPDGRKHAWLGQVGAVPTFRYSPGSGHSPWFGEIGIGFSFMTTLYETEQKRFSTSFNFADHLAFGFRFGQAQRQELAFRLRHFSNAGIKQPNPGENFLEVRYVRRL